MFGGQLSSSDVKQEGGKHAASSPLVVDGVTSDTTKRARTSSTSGGSDGIAAMSTSVDGETKSTTAGHGYPTVDEQIVRQREGHELDKIWPKAAGTQANERTSVRSYETSDYGWVPAFGLLTPATLQSLWDHGRTHYRLRDGGIVRLCKVKHLSNEPSTTGVHQYSGVLSLPEASLDPTELGPASTEAANQKLIEQVKTGTGAVSLAWLTVDPGRQLLTGAFHPIDDDQWEQRHEWQMGVEPLDLGGATFPSLMSLLQRRYASLAATGLEMVLPANIPTVVALIMASYLLGSEMTDLLQWAPMPNCNVLDQSTLTSNGPESFLPSDWSGARHGLQVLSGSQSLPTFGEPGARPLPFVTTGRPKLQGSTYRGARYDTSPNDGLSMVYHKYVPLTNDAARMLQSIIAFVIQDITQTSMHLGRRARRGSVHISIHPISFEQPFLIIFILPNV
jgi:hypothetical protein